MKKVLSLILAACLLFSFAACGGDKVSDGNTNAQSLAVCISSEPDTIDPALNSAADGATLIAHLFSGLAKWTQNEEGNLAIVADAAEELTQGVVNDDGTVTYTYTLKEGLTWSDGQVLTASDFVFAWNRAASPELAADYNYMFDVIVGYSDMWEEKETGEVDEEGNPIKVYSNPDAKLAVEAKDDRTLVVTLKNEVLYWNELLAFPNYYPVREDIVENEAWATNPSTYISNGPYTMSEWKHDSVITLTKNEKFHDADKVTMPEIKFYLSDDANNMLTNFKSGDWQFIDNIPTNEISNLKVDFEDEFGAAIQLGTYYVSWNINENLLPDSNSLEGVDAERAQQEIRRAISLLIDRDYIVNSISQCGEIPASSFVSMGFTEADNETPFYQMTGKSEDYYGYFDASKDAVEANYSEAVEILKKYYTFDEATQKFTDVPALTYIYNEDANHKAIGEYIQSVLLNLGITINLENQEWNAFLNTRKNGDYTLARNGWLADFNDPISFLDMWTSYSGNNDIQFGKSGHADLTMYDLDLTEYDIDVKIENGTWAETYDVLISEIKSCTDFDVRYKLMHLAEDMLMKTGCITPIYYSSDPYMLDDRVEGFYSNPLGYKYFMYTTIAK